MKKDYTDITIVLDRSGSMDTIAEDTKGGFNTFIEEQKKVKGKCTLTLVQFDTEYEFVHRAKPIEDIPSLDFHPRGGTALLDALGRSINETGERLRNLKESERPDKVIFVIITDGEENSSKEFTKQQINDMITHQNQKYNWQFVFLGANQDAIQEAQKIGIMPMFAINYAHCTRGVSNVFQATTSNIADFRMGASASIAYSDKDRKEAIES